MSVTAARRALLAKEYREVVATDTAVQTTHLLAPEITIDTLMATEADAQTEATRQLALRKVRGDVFTITVQLNDDTDALDLGDVIELAHNRYGLATVGSDVGRLVQIVGIEADELAGNLELMVWSQTPAADAGRNRITQDGIFRVTETGDYRTTQAA